MFFQYGNDWHKIQKSDYHFQGSREKGIKTKNKNNWAGLHHKIGDVLFLKLDGRFRGVHLIILHQNSYATFILLNVSNEKILKGVSAACRILSKSLKIHYQYNVSLQHYCSSQNILKGFLILKLTTISKILVTINLDIIFSSLLCLLSLAEQSYL